MSKIRLDQKPTLTQPKGGDYFPVLDYENLTSGGIPRLKKSPISSLKSAQPDRVIIIDTTIGEDIEGKAYSTFAAAKTYMEANPLLKFCVELPAGIFDEQITLDKKWTIHGNNTVIDAPLASTMANDLAEVVPSFLISDCSIAAGFETIEVRTPTDYGITPIYTLRNCTVTQLENAADNPSTYPRFSVVFMEGGVLKIPSCSDNGLKRCVLTASGVTVTGLVANQGEYYFYSSIITGSVTARNSTYSDNCNVEYNNCNFAFFSGQGSIYATFIKNSTFNYSVERIESSLDLIMSNVDIATHPDGSGSSAAVTISVPRQLYLRNTIIENVLGLEGSPHVYSDAISTQVGTTRVINRPIVYSTDGGATAGNMSNDPTGATHFGLCKDFTKVDVAPTNYMWIPMLS